MREWLRLEVISGCHLPNRSAHEELIAQDHVLEVFEYLQGGRNKKMFPNVMMASHMFQSVSIASGPVTEHHRK